MSGFVFEDFGESPIEKEPIEIQAETQTISDLVSDRANFDDGYNQGWSDGIASIVNDSKKLNADIALALQEAGFAYFEARQHVLNSMKPLVTELISSVLPTLAQETLVPRVVELVCEVAAKTEPPIKVLCAPSTKTPLEEVISETIEFPVIVEAEETLTTSQAVVQYDDGETSIDSTFLVNEIVAAVDDFYNMSAEEERISA